VASVLQAAAEEFARVGKTTVYRRWPTKMQLVAEMMRCEHERQLTTPDTGSLREDLRILLRSLAEQGHSPLARAWLAELGNPDLHAITQSSRHRTESQWITVVARAMARGELPAATEPLFLIEILAGPIVVRLIRGDDPPTDAYCATVIDLVLAGARAVAPPPRGGGSRAPTSRRATRRS
jgi:AcrR family transcriptional regulator